MSITANLPNYREETSFFSSSSLPSCESGKNTPPPAYESVVPAGDSVDRTNEVAQDTIVLITEEEHDAPPFEHRTVQVFTGTSEYTRGSNCAGDACEMIVKVICGLCCSASGVFILMTIAINTSDT